MAITHHIRNYAEFVKISHTLFALPFAIASMLVASRDSRGWPGWKAFLLILTAMTGARTCAMAFNRIVDRRFDGLNPRTSNRHLPAGKISLPAAVSICIGGATTLVASAYFLNPLCFYLSPIALFLICFYSLTKRFTDYTHVWLGLALGLSPIGAWLAVHGSIQFLPWKQSIILPTILALAVVFWLIGFDIIYALQDYEFDRKHGLRSVVVAWGPKNALKAAFLSHMLMWGLLGVFGLLCRFRIAYFVGIVIILLCLLLEHWLARRRSADWVSIAFFKLNVLISMVFLIATATEIIFPWVRFKLV